MLQGWFHNPFNLVLLFGITVQDSSYNFGKKDVVLCKFYTVGTFFQSFQNSLCGVTLQAYSQSFKLSCVVFYNTARLLSSPFEIACIVYSQNSLLFLSFKTCLYCVILQCNAILVIFSNYFVSQ